MAPVGVEAFFQPASKKAVREAIADAEDATCAEVVVAVRRSSGRYREADMAFGMLLAAVLLAVFLYHPEPFDFTYLPLELGFAFCLGLFLSASLDPIRRIFSAPSAREENVRRAARSAFFELGVGKTRDRNGVLVYVSAFERRVEIVPDVGVHPAKLGTAWDEAVKKLDRAVRLDRDVDRFLTALRELGPVLAKEHPRAHDDVNELADDLDHDDDVDRSPPPERASS